MLRFPTTALDPAQLYGNWYRKSHSDTYCTSHGCGQSSTWVEV